MSFETLGQYQLYGISCWIVIHLTMSYQLRWDLVFCYIQSSVIRFSLGFIRLLFWSNRYYYCISKFLEVQRNKISHRNLLDVCIFCGRAQNISIHRYPIKRKYNSEVEDDWNNYWNLFFFWMFFFLFKFIYSTENLFYKLKFTNKRKIKKMKICHPIFPSLRLMKNKPFCLLPRLKT